MATAGLFSEEDLRQAAGERSFGRGLGYLDAVGEVEFGADRVTATVCGTDVYEVSLGLGGAVTGDCSCPYGQEGNFCKHLVAVGLTVLGQARDVPAQRAAAEARAGALESWLAGLSRDGLLALVREQLHDDHGFRRRLELRAAVTGPDPGAGDGAAAAAWAAAAGVAGEGQRLALADLVSGERPADALPVYLRAIEALRSQRGDAAYQRVADLLTKIRDCHQRLGTASEFTVYLTWLRADQKHKPQLMSLLRQRGL